ncbi:unnamed protein product [Gongylonema pulchrum]|uniref:RING-Gid-type domain-containing protein n=1 Tax=Gongylonema pulchrum TaxID=637853 RepID=A0A183E4J4_9BILA|nr:unnamed protein product [Gongylonema pulchrum]
MAKVVAAQVNRVVDSLESFNAQWEPALARSIQQVEHVCQELLDDDDPEAELSITGQVVLEQCMDKLNATLEEMAYQHRSTHQMLSKIGKDIDQTFIPDLACFMKIEKNFDGNAELQSRVNALIINHLTSTGKFDVADIFRQEAGLGDSNTPGFNVDQIRHIMGAFQQKNIAPALEWLLEYAPCEEEMIYDLHKQHFIELLESGRNMEALQYSRNLTKCPDELMELMWALVRKDRKQRYPKLFNATTWQQLELRLAQILSRSETHLSEIIALGAKIISSLIHLRRLMTKRAPESIFQGDELPVEVDISNSVHSIFACPILKAQCTRQNPPMRLSCGHVISREALHKLSQSGRFIPTAHVAQGAGNAGHHRLKCPYCPLESTVADAKRVYF